MTEHERFLALQRALKDHCRFDGEFEHCWINVKTLETVYSKNDLLEKYKNENKISKANC